MFYFWGNPGRLTRRSGLYVVLWTGSYCKDRQKVLLELQDQARRASDGITLVDIALLDLTPPSRRPG